jgi:hypothetical protein
MEEVVREAIFGNVGTLISFRVGPTDAPYLAKEFMPTFEEDDLINLDKFQIYNKMAIDGVTSPPFSAQTLPPYTNKENNQAEIREYTRTNFAKPREEVEKWLLEWDKKASKSQNELKEEKLEEITYKGKKMYPIVGTDGRAWFIEKDNNGSSNQNSKEKNNKNNSSDGKNRGNKSNPVANKQKTKKALREHLKNLSKQMESNKDDRKKGKALKKNNNSNNKDHNGNHVMEEGRKVSLNGS